MQLGFFIIVNKEVYHLKPAIEKKQVVVSEIKERLDSATSVVVADYRGLSVEEATELRKQLREAGVDFKVLKNTLVKRACNDAGIEGLEDVLKGPTAIAFSEDAVAPSKILFDFAKSHKLLEIKGGLLEGKAVEIAQLKALAMLPSKEALLSQVAGAFAAPMQTMASLFAAPIRDLVGVVNAVKEKKEQAS
ncbi:50S ribosomal protein L10 [endosymbiont 'TC1' of Trimyema compressum]|uniref:50S ribosomal protein L10 n=1 Tax=endosymbiont 'TC1' of Trimyema compressum TaxID=243899 RepID=UPI0007F0A619|nr:50S ribosomal protein L10 [endosymbiont 'TC1' of Trimyema compressum]AMP21395.1 50S ribosomal protein L10 [endosymbiont 'TC1' of Trimyema compressum]